MFEVSEIGWGIVKDKNNNLYYYDDGGIFVDDDGNKYQVVKRDKDTERVLALKNCKE